MKPDQVDSELEEEHLFNFMVKSLNDELPLNLSEEVENATQAERGPRRRQRRWDLDQSRLRDGGRLAARQYRPWPSHRPVQA